MPRSPKRRDPEDFRLPEFFEPFCPIKFIGNDVIAGMHSKPVVKRCLSSGPGYVDVLA
jgi:hypothetical protein